MSVTKGTEEINEEGAIETKVEAVDYGSPAAKDQQPHKENASAVHPTRKGPGSPGGRGGGVLADAAQAVGKTFQSVKDTISGGGQR